MIAADTKEYINRQYDTFLKIYTDGAKNLGVGSAFFIPQLKVEKAFSISKHCSSFTAEISAILGALGWAVDQRHQKILIASDCLSALQTLEKKHQENFLTTRIANLQHRYRNWGREVTFIWIPSHCGIRGNEKADELAKSAAVKEGIDKKIPVTTREAGGIFYEICKTKWNTRYQESTTGNHYKTIQPSVFRSVDVQNMSRKYQTILFRLQSGHCNLRAHLHRIGKSDSPNCINCGRRNRIAFYDALYKI